jgi:hypothetical protein
MRGYRIRRCKEKEELCQFGLLTLTRKKYKGVGPRMATVRVEMKVLRAEWSDWGERHVRRSREGSGRALRESAEIQCQKYRSDPVSDSQKAAIRTDR